MKNNKKKVKTVSVILIIFFSILIVDRILVYFELHSILHYVGYVFGLLKGLFAG